MTQLDRFHQSLTEVSAEVAATLPPDRGQALLALLRAGEPTELADEAAPTARPGWNLALRLCLERRDNEDGYLPSSHPVPAAWAEQFLAECDQLALASVALAQGASGYLQLQERAQRTFAAWATSRRPSTEQREREDFDWWSAHAARQAAPRLAPLLAERRRVRALLGPKGAPVHKAAEYAARDPTVERLYNQLGHAYVARFAPQHSYPPDAEIGGATFDRYTHVLALLIGWLYRERDRVAPGAETWPIPRDERALVAALAEALDADPAEIGRALQPFVIDRDNAAYHSAIPGRAAPPLIRLDEGRVVWSGAGLLGEPLLFLARELRRRHAREYHNHAHLREGMFRRDLYDLFGDKRFVVSAARVELKRMGEARTDLDALIFDRKTGALGVFELKAQDPFARSTEERLRQRDNFLRANRQVSAILEWVQRHGPDDLLTRFDERAAKRFRVQKVYVFVLGRYLAFFSGGPEPDRRAAWGSWPQLLRIGAGGALDPTERNPLGTLFARLRDAAPTSTRNAAHSQEIAVRDLRLRIFPSFAEMRSDEDRPA